MRIRSKMMLCAILSVFALATLSIVTVGVLAEEARTPVDLSTEFELIRQILGRTGSEFIDEMGAFLRSPGQSIAPGVYHDSVSLPV